MFIALGTFNALLTVIGDMLLPRGISADQAGLIGGVIILFGLGGAAVIPMLSDKRHRRRIFLIVSILISLIGIAGLCYAPNYLMLLISGAVAGFLFNGRRSACFPIWDRNRLSHTRRRLVRYFDGLGTDFGDTVYFYAVRTANQLRLHGCAAFDSVRTCDFFAACFIPAERIRYHPGRFLSLKDKGETFAGVDYETGLAAVDRLKEIFKDESLVSSALKWILMSDEIGTVIPGASRKEQIAENIGAADIPPLTESQMRTVEEVYNKFIKEPVHHLW